MNCGIIGMGKMGVSHCSILGAHPKIGEIVICDKSKFLLSLFEKHSNFKCYTDYKKMIGENNLDFVIVATPTNSHFGIVKFLLSNNCHVFCEKPLVLNLKEGSLLNKMALERNLINQVGFHNRFIGTFKKTKELIDNNILGEIYKINGEAYGPVVLNENSSTWRSKIEEGGGCLYDYASHVINLIQFMVGTPTRVSGTVLKKFYSQYVEDAVFSSFIFNNGIEGNLSANWSEENYRKMTTKIEILGEKGKIISDSQVCKLFLKKDFENKGLRKGWSSFWITDQTKPVWFNLRGEEYSYQLDYFINKIEENNFNNLNSFEEAIKTDKIIEMLRYDSEMNFNA